MNLKKKRNPFIYRLNDQLSAELNDYRSTLVLIVDEKINDFHDVCDVKLILMTDYYFDKGKRLSARRNHFQVFNFK